VIALIEYNPYSSKPDLQKIKELPFSDQIKILRGGIGMWEVNLDSLDGY